MPDSGTELVTYDVRDGVAWARIDNGKANALSFDVLGGLDRCLTLAEEDAGGRRARDHRDARVPHRRLRPHRHAG